MSNIKLFFCLTNLASHNRIKTFTKQCLVSWFWLIRVNSLGATWNLSTPSVPKYLSSFNNLFLY
jgi:hypothetical protein